MNRYTLALLLGSFCLIPGAFANELPKSNSDVNIYGISPAVLEERAFGEQLAFDHGGMYTSVTSDGPAYLPPKSLLIYPFDLHGQPSVGANAGTLFIDQSGKAKLSISNSKVASIKALDKTLAKDLLGLPSGPQGEDENKPYFWTFNILATHAFELNIYHIDVQFADVEQHWAKYRVRGYQIANPQWQSVVE